MRVQIRLAESVDGDPNVFGFIIRLPSGRHKQVGMRISPNEVLAGDGYKHITTVLVDHLLHEADSSKDLNETNWVSVMACIQKLIIDWQAKRGAEFLRRCSSGKSN